jgi:hypothetical protein
MYYIYRHIRPDTNQVFYIGKGLQNTKRAWESRRRNMHWNSVVSKNNGQYKVDIIMSDLSPEEACQKEIEFISIYGKKQDDGTLVNWQDGGLQKGGYTLPEETKRRIGESAIGNKSRLGQKRSLNERIKQSCTLKKIHYGWNKGMRHSDDTKAKMSNSHKGNLSNTGKFWITNGEESTLILIGTEIPQGFKKGRIIKKKNQKL